MYLLGKLCVALGMAACLLGTSVVRSDERQVSSFDAGMVFGSGFADGGAQDIARQKRSDSQLLADWRKGSRDLGPVSLTELLAVANGAQQPFRISAGGFVEKVTLTDLMADARWRKKVARSLWRVQP